MWGFTPQNEPAYSPQNYEACAYTAEQHRDFVKNHLGPTLKKAYPNIKLMGYDFNKGNGALQYVTTNLQDPVAASYFDGTAVHWYDNGNTLGTDTLNAIHELNTSKFILATEGAAVCVEGSEREGRCGGERREVVGSGAFHSLNYM